MMRRDNVVQKRELVIVGENILTLQREKRIGRLG
jgi:hypothetical protein